MSVAVVGGQLLLGTPAQRAEAAAAAQGIKDTSMNCGEVAGGSASGEASRAKAARVNQREKRILRYILLFFSEPPSPRPPHPLALLMLENKVVSLPIAAGTKGHGRQGNRQYALKNTV